jgi:ATP-dependent Lhr-like helicase
MPTVVSDPLDHFHPIVARWFKERLGAPTGAQARGWAAISEGRHTLIAAPTGSGKTLAAFLSSLDQLLCEGLERGGLPDEVRVVYVSPLKALSTDIHKNLAEPRREIRQLAEEAGLPPVKITAAVRTGDTPQSEREAMLRTPPHILVTTPESLYLLLTAERTRRVLRTVRTVIVDEIHAVIESRRGAHLALSLERLRHVAGSPLQRIGLSATQRPIETVAHFLTGVGPAEGAEVCAIVDEGHIRELDLALELPGSPIEAVMAAEVWQEVFERIVALTQEHRTTLIFVNTRRLAERVARALTERLGEDVVAAHHGSLSKETRLDAEERLKTGRLRALVATASLELGIDIGHVDLVIQLASPRRISAFLQRVGRSGHTVSGTPKGRLVPLSRDDLVECAALIRAVRRGELDRLIMPPRPLDVLAQQVVAESACEDWSEDELFALLRGAYPYRDLERGTFDAIVEMVSRGFSTRRGRRAALVHHDAVNHRLRGRRGARHVAITSGGAIPEIADYRVELEPEGTFIGTLNEDFTVESSAGDVFQLGNTSWRILRVLPGVVRVADAHGEPPTIPFWLGEAPARSDELSAAVAALRADVESVIASTSEGDDAVARVAELLGVARLAAAQILAYLAEGRRMLGALPTQDTLILERFFDEAGGMQLVLHAPFGGRMNRAWGLALRKKFCRTFNFELQAAATDEGLLLSLGPQHSFPLDDVFRYLHPDTTKDVLVQAVLDAPVFQTRWRWNTTLSLAVQRSRNGRKVPPQIQRMQAEDLLAAVFPDAAACLENIAGDREVPDHPLVAQALEDCLEQAMDLAQLERVLRRIYAGEVELIARDTPEPTPLCHELVNARPWAFLDDAPLEERRTQAVYTRRALEPSSSANLGALDVEAIERVRAEAWPEAEDADELHDALLTCGFLRADELKDARWPALLDALFASGRAAAVSTDAGTVLVSAERLPELRAVHPSGEVTHGSGMSGAGDPGDALRDLLRSRLEISGPITAAALAAALGVSEADAYTALVASEGRGEILRGSFTPGAREREWCDRRLLARIHRYTLNRLRAEIQPVSPAEYMRFLFRWQRAEEGERAAGLEGLAGVIAQLEGFELPAVAWEGDVLPARCESYTPELLDMLCLSGRVTWGRLSAPNGPGLSGPLRTSSMSLLLRADAAAWLEDTAAEDAAALQTNTAEVLRVLEQRGALFFHEIVGATRLLPAQVEQSLGELAALGRVTADSFAGLRALLTPSSDRRGGNGSRRRKPVLYNVETAGRWSLLPRGLTRDAGVRLDRRDDPSIQARARALLHRWGVVMRRVLQRETAAPSWRDLVLAYRRLEARGEIRGGRFVSGFAGEQFALPEAVSQLRSVRREEPKGRLTAIAAADPLNLSGIVTPGERIPALATNRILYRDGVPVAAVVASEIQWLVRPNETDMRALEQALVRRKVPPQLRAYLRANRNPRRAALREAR